MSGFWEAAGTLIMNQVFGDSGGGGGQAQSAATQQLALATRALQGSRVFEGAKVPLPQRRDFASSQSKLMELPGFASKFEELMNLMGTDDLAKRQLAYALQELRPGITSAAKIGLERQSTPSARGPTIRV
jgi:hypothetical protein